VSNLPVPNAPERSSKNLSNNHPEFDPNIRTGVEILLENDEGYIVGRINNELLHLKTDAHLIATSPTGGGKGTGLIIPNLLAHSGSVFIIDIRGETVAKTANARRLQGQNVFVLDPYDLTGGKWGRDTYNPLDLFLADPESIDSDDIIKQLTTAIMFDPKGRESNEPIWDSATRDLITGLLTLCLRYWEPDRQNLIEIYRILTYSPPEKEEFINLLQEIVENDPRAKDDLILRDLVQVLTTSKDDTKIPQNAMAQAKTCLSWVAMRTFKKDIIKDSTFSFADMQDKKMTVYLVVPEQHIANCAIWVRLILENAVYAQKDIFNSQGISTIDLRQDQRVLFLLDELPAFGKLNIISKGMAVLRGRGINLWLFIQNMAQLDETYGKENARVIIGNASCLQAFNTREIGEFEYFGRLIGEEFYDVQTVSIGETITDGTSETKGKSYTIGNSSSITKTKGTSDTTTESTNINWNESLTKSSNTGWSIGRGDTYTKGTNSSLTKGKTKGKSKGETKGKSKGVNKGASFKRNLLFTTLLQETSGANEGTNESINEGTSEGTNESINEGQNESSAHSKNVNETGGSGLSKQTGKSGGKGKSIAHGVTNSEAEGFTESESNTKSDSVGKTHTQAVTRNISVKRELLKIETVGSLREKMSGRNQFLYIQHKDHHVHPFFCPRMSYFVKFVDKNRYMFPDMVALASMDALKEMSIRKGIKSLKKIKKIAHSISLHKNPILVFSPSFYSGEYKPRNLEDLNYFLSENLVYVYKKLRKYEKTLLEQRQSFSEIAISVLGVVSVMKDLKIDSFFIDADSKLIEQMRHLASFKKHEFLFNRELIEEYSTLPLFNLEVEVEVEEEEEIKVKVKGIKYKNVEGGGTFDLHQDDLNWLMSAYKYLAEKTTKLIGEECNKLNLQTIEQDKTRVWLKGALELIVSQYDNAVSKAYEREEVYRHQFFMDRHVND